MKTLKVMKPTLKAYDISALQEIERHQKRKNAEINRQRLSLHVNKQSDKHLPEKWAEFVYQDKPMSAYIKEMNLIRQSFSSKNGSLTAKKTKANQRLTFTGAASPTKIGKVTKRGQIELFD